MGGVESVTSHKPEMTVQIQSVHESFLVLRLKAYPELQLTEQLKGAGNFTAYAEVNLTKHGWGEL